MYEPTVCEIQIHFLQIQQSSESKIFRDKRGSAICWWVLLRSSVVRMRERFWVHGWRPCHLQRRSDRLLSCRWPNNHQESSDKRLYYSLLRTLRMRSSCRHWLTHRQHWYTHHLCVLSRLHRFPQQRLGRTMGQTTTLPTSAKATHIAGWLHPILHPQQSLRVHSGARVHLPCRRRLQCPPQWQC